MRKQWRKTKISSMGRIGRFLALSWFISFLFACVSTYSGEDPFFLSSENSRREDLAEEDKQQPEDLPEETETQLAEQEAARLAEEQRRAQEEAARLAEEERRAADQLAQEEAARQAAEKQRQEEARLWAQQEQQAISTTEPAGDDLGSQQAQEQEAVVPDFVLTGFKDEEIKVILEGEGWIMANPGPIIRFLRKEYSPTGQSIFYLKAAEDGEYMLFFSRSAAVGIEKRAVLLKVVPRESQKQQAQTTTQTTAPAQPQTTPQDVQPSPQQQRQPATPGATTPPQQTPAAPTLPQQTAPSAPSPGLDENQAPAAVVRDLTPPETTPAESTTPAEETKPATPVQVPTEISDQELANMSEKDMKTVFDALKANPNRMMEAARIGDAFIQKFRKSNLSAEVLYNLGQLFEQPSPNVDRQKAYNYYSQAYDNYPISPYSRLSKERMSYLEQFYLRLP